ncbi:Phosphatase yihX [Raoultella planticola]|uniref:Phosphatase yihX n=1 Tax=Raoultella planticola TaxID=575 RepID=A0A485BHZ0_RAOPL|nr:Phosphatase yihX [Raoultella planticola]
MLYIFDLGNVIVDIDFNRVLGTWSDLSRIPLATLKQHFTMARRSISTNAVKLAMRPLRRRCAMK